MTAAAQRAPIDLDAHRGSRWSMHIRDGLVDAKHYKAMGDAIWLYLYLHKKCAQKTGLVKCYRHQEAADALGLSLRSAKNYMDRLRDGGYVTTTRGHDHLAVQLSRYEWQEGRRDHQPDPQREVHDDAPHPSREVQETTLHSPTEVQIPALHDGPEEGEKCKNASREVQETLARTNSPLIQRGRTTANAVGADAPPTAQNHAPSLPSEKPAKAVRSRPVLVKEQQPDVTWESLSEDVAKVAAAWMGADSIRPQTAICEQIARYAAQAQRLLDHGHPAADLVGCVRALAKVKRETGKRWKVTPEMLADRVGGWQEQNGHAPDFFESNGHDGSNGAGSGPPWPSMPRGSIHDPETHAGREVFIAHFGKPPWMMSREEAIAAGVLDVYEKRRT